MFCTHILPSSARSTCSRVHNPSAEDIESDFLAMYKQSHTFVLYFKPKIINWYLLLIMQSTQN
jgi:hypothetical protein